MSSKLTALTTNPSPVTTDLIYVVPAAGGNQYKAALSAYSLVVGPTSATANAVPVFDGTTGKLVKNSTMVYDGTQQVLPNTATGGVQLFYTADQVTNYERLRMFWDSVTNNATIQTGFGGTGNGRVLILGGAPTTAAGNDRSFIRIDTANRRINFYAITNSQTLANSATNSANMGFGFTSGISSATSGSIIGFTVNTAYNQASGTAANTDLLINRTETMLGSGPQYLIQAQAGGTDYFLVGNRGRIAVAGVALSASTAIATPAGTTTVSSLRLPHGAAPTSPVDGDMWTTTAGLFVRVNGATVGPLS